MRILGSQYLGIPLWLANNFRATLLTNQKQKQIRARLFIFPPLHVSLSSSDWFTALAVTVSIGRRYFISFGVPKLNRPRAYYVTYTLNRCALWEHIDDNLNIFHFESEYS